MLETNKLKHVKVILDLEDIHFYVRKKNNFSTFFKDFFSHFLFGKSSIILQILKIFFFNNY